MAGRRNERRVASNAHGGKRVLMERYLKLTLKQFLALPKPNNYRSSMAAPHTASTKKVAHLSSGNLGTAVSIIFTKLIHHIHHRILQVARALS